jgi:hypothetical protein
MNTKKSIGEKIYYCGGGDKVYRPINLLENEPNIATAASVVNTNMYLG